MTPVIFRKSDGEITAVFPAEPWSLDPNSRACYAPIGQHSSCSIAWYLTTKPATIDESASLLSELVSIGYDDLRVVKRMTRHHREQVKNKLFGNALN